MNPRITEEIQKTREQLRNLEEFNRKYTISLPDELWGFSFYGSGCDLTIRANDAPNEDGRAKILSVVGDTFGRYGWTAVPCVSYGSHHYNWVQEFNGIKVVVNEAELMPKFEEFSVPPQKFPVLLEDKDSEGFHERAEVL